MKKSILIVIILVLAVLAGGAVYYFTKKPFGPPVSQTPEIISFDVQKPNLLLKGKNLAKVEIWAIPTGTGITEEYYSLLGAANLSETAKDGVQTWSFGITPDPILATDIFARAFDSSNRKVGDKSLPYQGATDIYNALWGSGIGENDITIWDNSRIFAYGLTERFTIRLNGDQYPASGFSVSPSGIVGEISNVPSISPPDYLKRYEAVKSGKATISNGDFSIDVYVYDQNAADKTYINSQYGFSFNYPPKDVLNQNIGYEFVTNNSLVRVDLPRNDFVDTNLGEAAFIVGASKDSQKVSDCLKISPEEQKQNPDQIINGVNFKVFEGMGAAAGNLYQTRSYRTSANNTCYEAVLLLHSGNIGNYSTGVVREFDEAKALSDLRLILNTFKVK